jgi:hypothetical protein
MIKIDAPEKATHELAKTPKNRQNHAGDRHFVPQNAVFGPSRRPTAGALRLQTTQYGGEWRMSGRPAARSGIRANRPMHARFEGAVPSHSVPRGRVASGEWRVASGEWATIERRLKPRGPTGPEALTSNL